MASPVDPVAPPPYPGGPAAADDGQPRGLELPAEAAPEEPVGARPTQTGRVRRSRTGGVWIGAIIAAVVLVILLIFILQNTESVTIHFFGLAGHLPIAVALLLAAICGLLLVAIPGTVRIMQLRKAVKRSGSAGQQRP